MPAAPPAAALPRRQRPRPTHLLLLLALLSAVGRRAAALAPPPTTAGDPTTGSSIGSSNNNTPPWRELLLLRAEEAPVPGRAAVVRYPPAAAGFSRASSDADLAPLVRDNLDPDLAPFRAAAGRRRRTGGGGGGGVAAAAAGPLSGGGGSLLLRLAAALRRAAGGETAPPAAAPHPTAPPLLTSAWSGGPGLSVDGFEDFVASFVARVPRHPLGEGNAALVVVRNGSVSAHWLRGRDNHFRFACLRAAAESARALRLPDTAFLLNIDDFPVCRVDGGAWPADAAAGVSGVEGGGGGGGGRNASSSSSPSSTSSALRQLRLSPGGGEKEDGAAPASLHSPAPLCPFPVLTNYKRWDSAKGGSYETNEVLLPVLNHHYEDAYFFPWRQKREKALMRASQQGCMPAASSRVALAVAAEREQEAMGGAEDTIGALAAAVKQQRGGGGAGAGGERGMMASLSLSSSSSSSSPQRRPLGASPSSSPPAAVLDAGVVRIDGRDKHTLKRRFSKAGFVPIEEHAKWKYLISADGCVAQTRLAKVLLANSVVLKEDSPWIEYYYRSLKPWVHYAPFRHRAGANAGEPGAADEGVRQAVARLKGDDAAAALVAAAGQRFAYRNLGQFSRLLYLRRLLVEYNALFGSAGGAGGQDEMAAWVRAGGPERAVARARGGHSGGSGGGGSGSSSG